MSLLVYHSRIIEREFQRRADEGVRLKSLTLCGIREYELEQLIKWCYTGRVDHVYVEDILETLWNVAADLEMPYLANWCMMRIFEKFARNLPDGDEMSGDSDGSQWAPWMFAHLTVFENNGDEPRRRKLLNFVETHLDFGSVPDIGDADEEWQDAFELDPSFRRWIMNRPRVADKPRWWIEHWDDFMVKEDGRCVATWKVQFDKKMRKLRDAPTTDVRRGLREDADDDPSLTEDFNCDKSEATKLFERLEHEDGFDSYEARFYALHEERLFGKRPRDDVEEDDEDDSESRPSTRVCTRSGTVTEMSDSDTEGEVTE